jgi:hypothetical protein
VVAGKVIESADAAFGFNARTEEYGDLFKFGVIEPAKVVGTVLQDAGLLITTEAMIAEKPEPKGQAGGGMPGSMGAWATCDQAHSWRNTIDSRDRAPVRRPIPVSSEGNQPATPTSTVCR